MRINFQTSGIIDAAAKRLCSYTKQFPSFRKISIDEARNLVSRSYGYLSYNHFLSNASSKEPQLKSLTQEQFSTLKTKQLKCLSSHFSVSEQDVDLLWMIITPAVPLSGYSILKIGQIGFCCQEWGKPDEDGYDMEQLKVNQFFIGISCSYCNGVGKRETFEQDDMTQAPIRFYGLCRHCGGYGVIHYSHKILNKIRLSKEYLQLKLQYDEYVNTAELQDSETPSLEPDDIYDPENPDPYTDWSDDEEEGEENDE